MVYIEKPASPPPDKKCKKQKNYRKKKGKKLLNRWPIKAGEGKAGG